MPKGKMAKSASQSETALAWLKRHSSEKNDDNQKIPIAQKKAKDEALVR